MRSHMSSAPCALFDSLDINGDGNVSKKELVKARRSWISMAMANVANLTSFKCFGSPNAPAASVSPELWRVSFPFP